MKQTIIIILIAIFFSCSSGNWGKYGKGIPASYDSLLDDAFARAGDNGKQLLEALENTPVSEKEGMAYLISYMPQGDLDTLNADILTKNVTYAYKARERFKWAKDLPDSVFFNEVLPYACVDERRENWREKFYSIFSEKVAGCKDINEAVISVNKGINEIAGVEYDTRREKTNQSPAESMRQHMASCTGLSIILTDAFRSVGIPARFAGTPAWHDDRGNHSWVEVFIDGEWYFTEFYYNALNDYWFLADAGKSDPNERNHSIYTTSYKPTGDYFPMVWTPESKNTHGVNVSQRYIDIYTAREGLRAQLETHVPVKLEMYIRPLSAKQSSNRVAVNVDVFTNSKQVGGGRTSGPTHDMNDILTFSLAKNSVYDFCYINSRGKAVKMSVEVGESPHNVVAYME